MSTATFGIASLADPVTEYLDEGVSPEGLMIIVLVSEEGLCSALCVPVAGVRASASRTLFDGRDMLDGQTFRMVIGFVYGETDPVAQNMCALWLDRFGELTKIPVHGLVVVNDGTATCRCGCSTAPVK